MGRAILFRALLITLSVMGGICFAEGYLFWAVLLWLIDGAALFFVFPLVEGDPSSRKNRLWGSVIPILFFVIVSGLVLFSRERLQGYPFFILAGVVLFYAVVVWALIKLRGGR